MENKHILTVKLSITLELPGPQKLYPMEGAVCLEAPKGTVILLHGDFNHFSHDNTYLSFLK